MLCFFKQSNLEYILLEQKVSIILNKKSIMNVKILHIKIKKLLKRKLLLKQKCNILMHIKAKIETM